MNIALIPNIAKPDAVEAAVALLELLGRRVNVLAGKGRLGTVAGSGAGVASGCGADRVMLMRNPTRKELADFSPGLAIVLGGDGSILSAAQQLGPLSVPVVGINFGKLGYLAAFSLDEFKAHLDLILSGEAPFTERLMLQAAVYPRKINDDQTESYAIESLDGIDGLQPRATGFALNDVVINHGEPFRMIELEVQIDEQRTTTFRADGVIVSTASGSTGYNLSAGGPVISPEVEAMVLTPICPHSLSFRPVVLPANSSVLIIPHHLNVGTKVNFDGQVRLSFAEEECVLVRRAEHSLRLIENPTISHWQMLARKLHWAQSPRQ